MCSEYLGDEEHWAQYLMPSHQVDGGNQDPCQSFSATVCPNLTFPWKNSQVQTMFQEVTFDWKVGF